jgi:hypothetical protein
MDGTDRREDEELRDENCRTLCHEISVHHV